MDMQKRDIFLIMLACSFFCFLGMGQAVWAQENGDEVLRHFQKGVSYDIYLQGEGDQLSIVKDVEILRLEEIYGKSFLVIRSSSFSLKKAEGFILFDFVKAVLPNRNLRVEGGSAERIYFR